MTHHLTEKEIVQFEQYLIDTEKSRGTMAKYLRDIEKFRLFLASEDAVDKETVIKFKEYLIKSYNINTANSILAALNSLFAFLEWPDCRVKSFKQVKRIFRAEEREMSRSDYLKLLNTAKSEGKERLYYIMQTLAATGIRISELKCITAEALTVGEAVVQGKGKERIVLLPPKLCRLLKAYCRANGIRQGSVFVTRNGKAVDRSNVWTEMKNLCRKANVNAKKVFPHNFRHLFAVTFYQTYNDIKKLADLLGHASIETTRIYLMEPSSIHLKQIERLNLII